MAESRRIVVCAEDTEAAAQACAWVVRDVYREGDRLHLVYVVTALMPPIEIFHGPPGTSYSFDQPGAHEEQRVIDSARAAIEARFLPILKTKMVPYELHLYAERKAAPPSRVGDAILKCAEERDASMVVLAAHNRPGARDKFMGEVGSVAKHVLAHCWRPLAVVPPAGGA